MKAQVFYNEDARMSRVWEPGDNMTLVTELEVDAEVSAVPELVYREMNRVDGTEFISREELPVRSMCVGDVVVIVDAGVWSADVFGFVDVSEAWVREDVDDDPFDLPLDGTDRAMGY